MAGAHWVLGVVGQDLALVGHEGSAPVLPGLRERGLLHDELASEPVQVRRDDAVDPLVLDPGKGDAQLRRCGGRFGAGMATSQGNGPCDGHAAWCL
ncbi:hypothetical protein ACFVY1_25950 [Streptomyces sp. NPDC058293]|uniref:hypothetical protein n=1 Tax=Streptomyces sp. NPDC058293 TaxID=3346429 RepID=UPI0036E7801C